MKTLFKIKDKNGNTFNVKDVYTFSHYTFFLVEVKKGKYKIWHEHGMNCSAGLSADKNNIKELANMAEATVAFLQKKDYIKLNADFTEAMKVYPIEKVL